MDSSPAEVTSLLNRLAEGDQEAAAKLVPLVYDELRRIAASRLRHERPHHTLQTTALVHEAYLKLAVQRNAKWQNRAQFFGVASQVMRRILVDYARTKQRIRRGGKQQRQVRLCHSKQEKLITRNLGFRYARLHYINREFYRAQAAHLPNRVKQVPVSHFEARRATVVLPQRFAP